jgi:pellino
VSVRGKIFGPRKSFNISEQFKFVPGERLVSLTNELMDGSIIDLGGCMLLFKRPNQDDSSENGTDSIRDIIKNINDHRPQCPVLFQPLQFSEISLKEKQHRLWDYLKGAHHRPNCSRNTMAPEFFSEELKTWQSSTPYVFSSCGHVYGYSKELEGRSFNLNSLDSISLSSCPMCRKSGPYLPLILPSDNSICSKKPTHVFNPCGHAASLQVCQQWSEIPLPDLRKASTAENSPCCPYCLK